ncbi:DHA2 family efflux MFS transporter permease subunit [Psychromonas sp. 14N.309.X.WAT.B.A12]|uniref:DHA2 family efflux MFS transporter permease subunit n=1 Tax=unclassified Psychromonas TaxID=2614957 RepID=UPI0025B14294|nr:DHA2 family efflux MFS transporter permease subunit [Psychromonas sp. 14N.309.X.WAT.B.A12]MDN2663868.1 DHA2 family efflux MFS transporter permease subunit [Psychromonas sp. 14N.309.X.WAT.B.A12]
MQDQTYTPPSVVLATIALAMATFMQVLDSTIANVALPTIAGNLGVSSEQSTWIITSFAVSNAIALPLTGWLSRRFGQLKLFIISVSLFTFTSFLCGIATSMPELITFRALQGFFAGPMFPMCQTLLLAIFPTVKRGAALALISMVTVVAPIVGPITGGWITDNYSWPWIFFINIPIGIFCCVIVWQQLKGRIDTTAKLPIDFIGIALLVLGVGMLQVVLDLGNNADWFESTQIVIMTIISVIALISFVIWELTEKNPIVNLYLFKDRNYTFGTIALVVSYAAFFAINVILPQWLQIYMGYTAIWAGLASAPMGILPLILAPLIGNYAHKTDLRLLASISFVVIGVSCFLRAHFNSFVDFASVAEVQLFMGIGIAFMFMPLTTIFLSNLDHKQVADASGLTTFLRVLGSSFASSLTTWIWNRRADFHHANLTEHVSIYNPGAVEYLDKMGGVTQANLSAVNTLTNSQSYLMSLNDYFYMLGWLFFALIVVVWFAKGPFIKSSKSPEAVGGH